MERPTAGLSQQFGEAGGSLNLETQARTGSSPDNDGTGRHCQTIRVRQARRNGASRSEPVVEPPQAGNTGSNLADLGRAAVGQSSELPATGSGRVGYLPGRRPSRKPAAYRWQRLQGKSWAPPPSIGREVNVGTIRRLPSRATSLVARGQARRRPMAPGWDGVRGVVGGRESRPQGEGGQRSCSAGECGAGGRR